MKHLTPALLAIALVAGAALWLKACHDPAVRRQAQLVASSDSLDRDVAQFDSARAARAAADSVARARRQRATTDSLQRLAAATAAATRRGDSLEARLSLYGDSVYPVAAVQQLLAEKNRTIVGLQHSLALTQMALADSTSELSGLRADLARVTGQRDRALEQRDAWRKEARRGLEVRPCAWAGASVPQFEARAGVGVCVS